MGMQENPSAEAMVKTAAKDVNASLHGIDLESMFSDLGQRLELAVKRALTTVQVQSKAYMHAAEEGVETAQHYVADQVRAKPVTAMVTALGAGVLLGLLLGAGRKR